MYILPKGMPCVEPKHENVNPIQANNKNGQSSQTFVESTFTSASNSSKRKSKGERLKMPPIQPKRKDLFPEWEWDKKSEKRRDFHTFSPELAKYLNPERPDFSAALVHHCLYTWQCSNRLDKPQVAFRSIRQLEQELPYLNRSTIHETIDRLESKKVLLVNRSNQVLEFRIPENVIKKYRYGHGKRTGKLWLVVASAKEFGILEGILLGNLSWMMQYFDRPNTVDDAGEGYYKLDPSILQQSIPKSKKAISVALKGLVKQGKLIVHKTLKWHYRYVPIPDTERPESDNEASIPDDAYPNPDSGAFKKVLERASVKAQMTTASAVDSSIDGNIDLREDCKGVFVKVQSSPSASTEPFTENSNKSDAFRILEQCIADSVAKQKGLRPLARTISSSKMRGAVEVVPGEFDANEMIYEWIARDENGKIVSWADMIDKSIHRWKTAWKKANFGYIPEDIIAFRNLLISTRAVQPSDIDELVESLECCHFDFPYSPYKSGLWDGWYFHRRVKNLNQLMRYLPQLIREQFGELVVDQNGISTWCEYDDDVSLRFLDLLQCLTPDVIETVFVEHANNPMIEKPMKLRRISDNKKISGFAEPHLVH